MPSIRLSDTYWLEREASRVEGVLAQNMPREGLSIDEALALLAHYGLKYTRDDLLAIKDVLVAKGMIEVVPE